MRKHILWKSNPRNYFLQSQVYILLSCCVVVVVFFYIGAHVLIPCGIKLLLVVSIMVKGEPVDK